MTSSHPVDSDLTDTRESAPSTAKRRAATGITAFGCTRDEAALFRVLAPRFGVLVTVTDAAVTEANVDVALGDRCISVSHKTPITNPALRALGQAGVTYISTRSIGTDHIDVDYAERLGITVEGVTYSPGCVADHTLMLMLMAVRHVKPVILRAAVHDYRLGETRGKELRDLTVGVIGTGRIGAAVAERLRGFGCQVLTHDKEPQNRVDRVPLDDLVQQSDVVTLHTPLTADTYHVLDRRRIGQMKPGAFIVNTGRGALLDTAALLDALEDGRLGGAALDVIEGEERAFYAKLGSAHTGSERLLRLQAMPNVLITPHIAYYTDHAVTDMVEHTLVNCLGFELASRRG